MSNDNTRIFIERTDYFDQLDKHASDVHPTHLSVYGFPHVGKSRLIADWQDKAINDAGNEVGSYSDGIGKIGDRFFYFVRLDDLDDTSNSAYVMVVKQFVDTINRGFKKKYEESVRFFSAEKRANFSKTIDAIKDASDRFKPDESKPKKPVSTKEATDCLRDVIQKINNCGLRVALIIDEFQNTQRLNNSKRLWEEEDYRQFCQLLLDKGLDLFCIIISRPHLSYIVNEHIYKLMPFEPLLVKSFSDKELKEYFKEFKKTSGLDLENDKEGCKKLLTFCGNNPYLLNDATEKIYNDYEEFNKNNTSGQYSFLNLLNTIYRTNTKHYRNVVGFMHAEEAKKFQSFTHIVKCYFGTSDDYEDILERYFDLGYIEKVKPGGLFSETCMSNACYDDAGNATCYYTTICQGFVYYLYNTQLDQIKDIRALFTGFLHTLRSITEEELKNHKDYKNDPKWYEKLFLRFRHSSNSGEKFYAERYINRNTNKYCWRYYPYDKISVSKRQTEIDGLEKPVDKMIDVGRNALKFVTNVLNNGGVETDVLDAINLEDHGSILLKYSDCFEKYFGILGDLTKDDAQTLLWDCLKLLQNDIRNQISHYSRRKIFSDSNFTKPYKELIVELLKSIYGRIASGKTVVENATLIESILNDIECLKKKSEYKNRSSLREARGRFLDKIRGGLIGGAIGDALGYPVKSMDWEKIQSRYEDDGIQSYDLNFGGGTAILSDDTQMSLFTANGILRWETLRTSSVGMRRVDTVYKALREWASDSNVSQPSCWLYNIRGLHYRSPDETCLSALRSGSMGTIEAPLNRSKGCGGVMRLAPLGLRYEPKDEAEQRRLDRESADIAAITHGHPLGYIPAAILTHIVGLGVYGDGTLSLKGAVDEAWTSVKDQFKDVVPSNYLAEMEELLVRAKTLAEAPGDDEEHVEAIGKGWTGDEALAIAVYCALRYPTDFSKAVVAAVNHGGDSATTGAIVGNILGAWLGYDAIEEKWKTDLEMHDVLIEMANDLCFGCLTPVGERLCYDAMWNQKYCQGHTRDKAREIIKKFASTFSVSSY